MLSAKPVKQLEQGRINAGCCGFEAKHTGERPAEKCPLNTCHHWHTYTEFYRIPRLGHCRICERNEYIKNSHVLVFDEETAFTNRCNKRAILQEPYAFRPGGGELGSTVPKKNSEGEADRNRADAYRQNVHTA